MYDDLLFFSMCMYIYIYIYIVCIYLHDKSVRVVHDHGLDFGDGLDARINEHQNIVHLSVLQP